MENNYIGGETKSAATYETNDLYGESIKNIHTMVEPRLISLVFLLWNNRRTHLADGKILKGGGRVPLSSK